MCIYVYVYLCKCVFMDAIFMYTINYVCMNVYMHIYKYVQI
jgi:hypothetical protein